MNVFLLSLFLALLWAGLFGTADWAVMLFGFVIGFVLLRWIGGPLKFARVPLRIPQALGLVIFLFYELILSSVRVARDVVAIRPRRRPGIVGIPLEVESDAGIMLLANLITLTPGSLSLVVSRDRRTLYVHGMFVEDPEAFRSSIKQGFERLLLRLLER